MLANLRLLVIASVLGFGPIVGNCAQGQQFNAAGLELSEADRNRLQRTIDLDRFEAATAVETEAVGLPELPAFPELPVESSEVVAARASRASFGFGDGDQRAPFRARMAWLPPVKVSNQPGNWEMHEEQLSLGAPLRIDEDGLWLALASVEQVGISTSAAFANSALAIPNQLWDIEFGVMHVRNLGDDRRAGGMIRIGSPSDRPFDALRDMSVTLLAWLTVPSGDRDAWNFSLFYSPTGQIIFPIPGIAYVWRPNDQFQATLGIPFGVEYRPTERLTFTANYRPLTNVEVLARFALNEHWTLSGGYRTVNETYWLSDRTEDRERTYFFDQRLSVGLQRSLGPRWNLELSTSYVFDRHVFQAVKFSGPRRDEIDIDAGLCAAVMVSWTRP